MTRRGRDWEGPTNSCVKEKTGDRPTKMCSYVLAELPFIFHRKDVKYIMYVCSTQIGVRTSRQTKDGLAQSGLMSSLFKPLWLLSSFQNSVKSEKKNLENVLTN